MMKYFLVDEEGECYYFPSLLSASKFLGVPPQRVKGAIDNGSTVIGYTADLTIM